MMAQTSTVSNKKAGKKEGKKEGLSADQKEAIAANVK